MIIILWKLCDGRLNSNTAKQVDHTVNVLNEFWFDLKLIKLLANEI